MLRALVLSLAALSSLSAQSVLDAHNCYPYNGQYADRIDRALNAGFPVSIEQDLAWSNGRIVLSHSAQTTGDEPSLETYFFQRVRPLIEDALRKNDRAHWPLIYLHFDFKDNRPELLRAVWDLLGRYEPWLTTAIKPQDPKALSAYNLGPVMALTEDNDAQEAVFYTAVAPGQKLRVFGSAHSPATPPGLTPQQRIDLAITTPPEKLLTDRPTAYRRWWNNSWYVVEQGGARGAGEWNSTAAARLKSLVDYSHDQGFRIRFYTVDGFTAETNRGWDAGYNFGSLARARTRWQAEKDAKVDFIATDQYEELGQVLHPPVFSTTGGTLLLGGGTFPPDALSWLLQKAGHGDIVILRTDHADAPLTLPAPVHSLQTLTIDTPDLARDATIVEKVRNASAVWIQGESPARLIELWRYTPLATAIDFVATKGAPLVASGAAISLFGGLSPNPATHNIEPGMLTIPYLGGLIAEGHFNQSRVPLLQASVTQAVAAGLASEGRALGLDDATALTINPDGKATVWGKGAAHFLRAGHDLRLPAGSTFDLPNWQQ